MGPATRKQYDLNLEVAALADIEAGLSQAEVTRRHNIPSSSLSGRLKKKEIIQQAVKSGKVDKKIIKDCVFPKTEAARS